jgi:hypothetical protein
MKDDLIMRRSWLVRPARTAVRHPHPPTRDPDRDDIDLRPYRAR